MDEQAVVQAYLEGKKAASIQAEHHLTPGSFYRLLHKHGIALRQGPAALRQDGQEPVTPLGEGGIFVRGLKVGEEALITGGDWGFGKIRAVRQRRRGESEELVIVLEKTHPTPEQQQELRRHAEEIWDHLAANSLQGLKEAFIKALELKPLPQVAALAEAAKTAPVKMERRPGCLFVVAGDKGILIS